ncbi:hypothetical protein [Pleurocapsa sp. PCC 7319]|uniref:hypothetical protein n=1 Tax=Pleurocapsa sp. PCC 7319 TaxID=118161 RepID=UPI00037544C1|nr:hypothetical protein [Pleurocapsa sp. PCC 7319]
MPSRIIKIPESMKDTHELIDGKLVKKSNISSKKVSKKKKEDHPLVVLIVGIGIIFFSCQQNEVVTQQTGYNSSDYYKSSEYINSVKERSSVGETIDSVQELVDLCMMVSQDKGMTYSQAYRTCN